MNIKKALIFGGAMWLLASGAAFADVQLTIRDGQVTLVAKDATVREILTEWARIGQTKIVNVERIPGGPLTLEFNNLPEEQALDVLLRSVSGYMVAPRPAAVASLSRFDRIVVMPTSAAPRAQLIAAPAPVIQQPQFAQPADPDADDERTAPNVGPNRGPVFSTFPQPQVVNPQGGQGAVPGFMPSVPGGASGQQQPGGVPGAFPGSPGVPAQTGVPVPGMIVQPPPQQAAPAVQSSPSMTPPPGAQGAYPGTPVPGQPVRRPGGQ